MTTTEDDQTFGIGDRAFRTAADHTEVGTIRAVFSTKRGKTRYVFEYDKPAGLLHICAGSQLCKFDTKTDGGP